MDFLLRINQGIKFRNSGKLAAEIDNLKLCLDIFDDIDVSSEYDFYISWYKNYLKNRLILSKVNRYIPGIIIPNKIKLVAKNAINNLIQNDRIILKDIILPLPVHNREYNEYMHMITDSILAYLLDNMEKNELYSLYSLILSQTEGLYEYSEVQLKESDIVIDAGANIGEFSALAGVKGCKVYAFEPIPNIINAFLSKTSEWNPGITICEYALSDKASELYFDEDMDGISGSSFIMPLKKSKKVKIQAIDLDTFVEKNNLPQVDFIKADIEGAERYMLMGAKRVLKEFAPKIAICTYHLPDDSQILRELILDSNPNYIIEERWRKMYAYVPA
jgi:FkbM family methyltransferase